MNQDLHNPAGVTAESLGPNHKLLSAEDLSKPPPEGAEYWGDITEQWHKAFRGDGELPDKDVTYRIPLTLSDRLRKDVARLVDLILVVEAVEKGAEWEFITPIMSTRDWLDPRNHPYVTLEYAFHNGYEVRLKPLPPTPHSIPWTLETRPLTEVWVKRKHENLKARQQDEFHIGAWCSEKAFVTHYGWQTYQDLHSEWLQRNGEPAGEKVTV